MRPGVVWFGEQLEGKEIKRVEDFLAEGPCHTVIVAGTTAMFGYIVDWAARGRACDGTLDRSQSGSHITIRSCHGISPERRRRGVAAIG